MEAVSPDEWDPRIKRWSLQFQSAEAEAEFLATSKEGMILLLHRSGCLGVFTSICFGSVSWLQSQTPSVDMYSRSAFAQRAVAETFVGLVSLAVAIVTKFCRVQNASFRLIEVMTVLLSSTAVIGMIYTTYLYQFAVVPVQGASEQAVHQWSIPEAELLLGLVGLQLLFQVLDVLRWRTLLVIVALGICLISVVFATTNSTSVDTLTSLRIRASYFLTVFLICFSKYRSESKQRRLVLLAIDERIRRAQTEFRLENTIGARMQAAQSSDAASGSKRTTVPSTYVFAFNDAADTRHLQMQAIAKLGRADNWLIEPDQLELSQDVLGTGGFGCVVKGTLGKSRDVAVKCPAALQDTNAAKSVALEVRALRNICHPNIVEFYGCCVLPSSGSLLLVEELITGITLHRFVQRSLVDICAVYRILHGVVQALNYLHTRNPITIHGDLKPGNVLIKQMREPTPKLVDFGMSQTLRSFRQFHGYSTRYAAPEVLAQSTAVNPAAADMFSFGGLVFFSVTGRDPSAGMPAEEIKQMAKQGCVVTADLSTARGAPQLHDCCQRCRSVEEADRPSAQKVEAVIQELLPRSMEPEQNPEQLLISELSAVTQKLEEAQRKAEARVAQQQTPATARKTTRL